MTVTRRKSRGWTDRDRAREKVLLAQMRDSEVGSADHQAARDELVTMHLPLVTHLARRFRDRGEPHDDLVQVGTVGLIKAVDRFDTDRGVEFSTFATPTIAGEIKRHFRDRGWSIRVPRRLQEMRQDIGRATQELSQRTGHTPTVKEIATFLEVSEDEVLEGLEGAQAYSTLSLDSPAGSGDGESDAATLTDTLGSEDDALEGVEYRESLKPLLAELTERERQIIMMRFFKNMTQAQIADEVGVSQMHVSRLLTKALAQLRTGLTNEDNY
ncbi:MAG: RNA polymerase sigma factor SigF [Candidatus Nanopelagicales bacterium]